MPYIEQGETNKKPAQSKKQNRIWIALICAVICVVTVLVVLLPTQKPNENSGEDSVQTTAADDSTDSEGTADDNEDDDAIFSPEPLDSLTEYYADIEIEDYGTIVVKLDQQAAPVTCAGFAYMLEMGHFDYLTMHSLINGNILQGGTPKGSGVVITGEYAENDYDNPLAVTAGAISLVPTNDGGSTCTQFIIFREDCPELNGKYPVFGYVIEGMDVLEQICQDMIGAEVNGVIAKDAQPVIDGIMLREVDIEIEDEE